MSKSIPYQPVWFIIVELLEKKGAMNDDELFRALKETYGDLSLSSFNKALIKLEIEGLIRVTSLTKSKKNIELIPKSVS
jgi:DNA-binding PadR family transcriptional regulator